MSNSITKHSFERPFLTNFSFYDAKMAFTGNIFSMGIVLKTSILFKRPSLSNQKYTLKYRNIKSPFWL